MPQANTPPAPERGAPAPPGLRLFLDSARPEDWERLLPLGFFRGVTTNPLLLQRADQPCTVAHLTELAARARECGAREIHLQTWGETPAALYETGLRLAACAAKGPAVVVKVPATADGFTVARRLAAAGLPVTMTAVHTPGQVVAAAALGAAYAAPYLGRLEDAGRPGRELVLTMHGILAGTGAAMRLLVASLRQAAQVVDLAARGLDTFTFGPQLAAELLADDMTAAATAQFQAAARAMGGEDPPA